VVGKIQAPAAVFETALDCQSRRLGEPLSYPERFAQQALGHNSKAVHHAYSKHAEVTVPSLDDWEKDWEQNPQRHAQPKLLPMDF
jgi:hypothetical protein